MSNAFPPPVPQRRLPLGPPSTVSNSFPSAPSSPVTEAVAFPTAQQNGGLPKLPNLLAKKQPADGSQSFTDVFDDDQEFFTDVPRKLVVNEQPFFRWFKRVFLALTVTSLFLLAVTFFVKAPWEIGLTAVGAVWVVVLAFALPEAIIPYKKTTFDLSNNTIQVGQKKPAPIADIKIALLTVKNNNSKLWLGFNDKDGVTVPLKSSKFVMKKSDLLALRTIIPHTAIPQFGDGVDVANSMKSVEVAQNQTMEYIESLIGHLKS